MKEHKFVKETPVVIYDKDGFPSMMLKLENTAPSKEEADPIFIVKGQEYDSIYLSRFINSIMDGHAVSLPFMNPAVMLDMDEMIAACKAKGEKWHLLTIREWRYIVDRTIEGIHGNTSSGSYHGDASEHGIKGSRGLTLTGSGPASWFHNGDKETGIADVVGLVWKTVAGLRLKNGIVEYMKDNDAAAPDADLSEGSKDFLQITVDGLPVRIGSDGDGLKITTDEVSEYDYDERRNVEVELSEVPEILKDLGIITEGMKKSREWLAADPELEECVCYVGASYSLTSNSGPSALDLSNVRSLVNTNIGFLSALLGEPVIR